MNVQIAFHGIESSPAVDSIVRNKIHKLDKFFKGNMEVHWTCSADKAGQHSHAKISAHGHEFNASDTTEDMYKTVDNVITKLDKQMRRNKEIVKNNLHRSSEAFRSRMEPEEEPIEEDDDE